MNILYYVSTMRLELVSNKNKDFLTAAKFYLQQKWVFCLVPIIVYGI